MNYNFFHSLKNKRVKDLYWLLFKPRPLISCPEPFNIPFFPEEIIRDWEHSSRSYFLHQDSAPSGIDHFVRRKKNYRLGFYAEALLSYFFQSFSDIELILQNFQITTDKHTLGEIDFIIKYNDRLLHLELAVKYYLLLPNSDPYIARNWIGPSRKDNLHKKLNKVEQTQLGHARHASVKSKLPIEFINTLESFFFFRGQFFKHNSIDCSPLIESPLRYYFSNEVEHDGQMTILRRPNWLSAIDDKSTDVHHSTERSLFDRPQLVRFPNEETAFVVPENWND